MALFSEIVAELFTQLALRFAEFLHFLQNRFAVLVTRGLQLVEEGLTLSEQRVALRTKFLDVLFYITRCGWLHFGQRFVRWLTRIRRTDRSVRRIQVANDGDSSRDDQLVEESGFHQDSVRSGRSLLELFDNDCSRCAKLLNQSFEVTDQRLEILDAYPSGGETSGNPPRSERRPEDYSPTFPALPPPLIR